MPRSSVNDANRFLRPTVREGDDGRSAVSFNGAGHPGATMCETVLRLDPSDAEIPASAGLSAGTMLPVKITARKFELIGGFPVATQAEYDALTDAQKDQATILDITEAPIGSEAKCYEHDGDGNVVDCLTWIRRKSSWMATASSPTGYRTLSSFCVNLWDPTFQVAPNIVTGSYINGAGVITALGGYNVSSHIPVTVGEVLVWWNDQLEDMAEKGAFFNAAGVFLSTIGANALYGGNKILIRVPANAATIRTNFRLTTHKYWLGSRRATPRAKLFEKLTFEGDSLFAGSGTYYDKTVPQRIGELFQIPIENHAVGGRRISGSTAAALWSQITATDHLASAGVFMAGYNDWANNVALGAVDSAINTEFNGALNILLDYLAKGRPWQKWYIVTPPPSTTASPNGLGLTLREYCQAIIDACLRKGFTCIDLNKDWGIDYRNQWMGMLYSSDGIHENWFSTDLMAGYLYHQLQRA